jgi:hypothetical protein
MAADDQNAGSGTDASTREHRRSARIAARGRRRVAIEWIVIPTVIALVFVIGFGLKLLI